MLVRIVKMSFKEDKIDDFINNFNVHKDKIRNTQGCKLLELYRDKTNPTVFFTYSYWETELDLENYRNSELFVNVWNITKLFFKDKPEAWSIYKVYSLQ